MSSDQDDSEGNNFDERPHNPPLSPLHADNQHQRVHQRQLPGSPFRLHSHAHNHHHHHYHPRPQAQHRHPSQRLISCRNKLLLDWTREGVLDSLWQESSSGLPGRLTDEIRESEDGYEGAAGSEDESWNSRIANLFLNPDQPESLCDVTFVIKEENDDSPVSILPEFKITRLKAHKFILALRSPVFHTMFFGSLPETSDEITVPDVSASAFRDMLCFVYKDRVKLQTDRAAWELWYVAKKYMIDALETRCRTFLTGHLTPLNVLDTYVYAELYGDPLVMYQCLRLIDTNAQQILASDSFTKLSIDHVQKLSGRLTLSAREVDIFEGVLRWMQAELERRIESDNEGKVPSLKEVFNTHFKHLFFLKAMTSQEFVHRVLPHKVLQAEDIADVSVSIRQKEVSDIVQGRSTESVLPGTSMNSQSSEQSGGRTAAFTSLDASMGLNLARDLLNFEKASTTNLDSFLRTGVVHTMNKDGQSSENQVEHRVGPGYYQLSRFSPRHELALVWKWPREYSLKFKADKSLYLLGACITETDRKFYSPRVKYFLKLKDPSGKVISEGSETFIKKTSTRFEGGYPKALDYGPHDVAFKNIAYINKGMWYELSLKIADEMRSVCPLLVCKCKNKLDNYFGIGFEFEPSYVFNEKLNNIESFKRRNDNGDEDTNEDLVKIEEEEENYEVIMSKREESSSDLNYGLISRLYFFY